MIMDDAPEEEKEGKETSGHDVQKSGQNDLKSVQEEKRKQGKALRIHPYRTW